ncbi:MAG: hypothetical protein ACM30G_02610 [Micromonosporaceae bacterium]
MSPHAYLPAELRPQQAVLDGHFHGRSWNAVAVADWVDAVR